MSAQLILAEKSSNGEAQEHYYRRAVGVQKCNYDDSMALAEFTVRTGRQEEAKRWLETASYFAEGDAWRGVKIADLYLAMQKEDTTVQALALYESARKIGETSAYYRLVKYYGDEKNPAYEPQKAGALFVDLLKASDLAEIPEELELLSRLKPAIRNVVSAKVDIADLYKRSAESGQPVAMRELAKIMQDRTDDNAAPAEAVTWLTRSADAGDAEAMYLLSQAYAFGSGVEPSMEKVRFWLKKAADKGYQEAVRTLALTTLPSTEGSIN